MSVCTAPARGVGCTRTNPFSVVAPRILWWDHVGEDVRLRDPSGTVGGNVN